MRKNTLLFVILIIMGSCTQKKQTKLITEKIQYDVQIKATNPDADWWADNIEGSQRDMFVESLLTDALNGKIEVYDVFTNNKISEKQLEFIRGRVDTVLTQNPDPPYNDTTIIIEQKLEYRDVTRVRFWEEWVYNGKDIRSIEKKIVAIAPLLENYDEYGNFRGYQPLFWIYTE